MNELEKGIEHLELSILNDPQNPDTLRRFADYYKMIGDSQLAVQFA